MMPMTEARKTMKLLLINHFPLEGSGSGVYARNLAKALAALGHDVQVLVPDYLPADTLDEGFITHTVLFEDPGASQAQREKAELPFPFPCFTTHPKSHFTFYDMEQAQIDAYQRVFRARLSKILTDFEPDLIHVGHVWVLAELVRESGRPYVVTSHGTDLMGFNRDERFRRTALDAAAGARRVITISRQTDAEVEERLGVEPARRTLIYSGCDTGLFHRKALSREERDILLAAFGFRDVPDFVVCFAGKLVSFKGADVLLAAAALYERCYEGRVATVIAGDGVLKASLMAQANTLGLQGVRFVGHQSQKRLAELYGVSDVFAMPSRSEPFGLAALEAMACGLPVVGTSAGGLGDMITPEVGRLVPVDDPQALADSITELLKLSLPDKSDLRQRCIHYVEDHFSWEATAMQTERVYRSCLQGEDKSGPDIPNRKD